MAHDSVTEWKCDRCGKKEWTPTDTEASEQEPPVGWASYDREPLHPDNAEDERERPRLPERWEVCGGCDGQTARFLMNGTAQADHDPRAQDRLDRGLTEV